MIENNFKNKKNNFQNIISDIDKLRERERQSHREIQIVLICNNEEHCILFVYSDLFNIPTTLHPKEKCISSHNWFKSF